MSYFKVHQQRSMNRPVTTTVIWIQLIVTVVAALVCLVFALSIGASVALGGLVSVLGQAYYNFRALRNFGSADVTAVISATYSAMWGKWLIVIAFSLAAVISIKELNAGVVYLSVFCIHTLGALLLPVLVKRVA